MNAVALEHTETSADQINRLASELATARERLARLSLSERIALMEDCLARVVELGREWVGAACSAKGIAAGSPLVAEEVAAGPLATARHLRLLINNYNSVQSLGHIPLPGKVDRGPDGALHVQVMPVRGLFDSIVFSGFKATSWLASDVSRDELDHLGSELNSVRPAKTVLVLGAGNVSSIPATDTISKVFQEGHAVLLKMNPVNDYLGPIFERLFARLVEAGYVRIVYGGAAVGKAAIDNPAIDEVHITGSIVSHDAIAWGSDPTERERRKAANDPLLKKPITSELGNVSPWIIVPGSYSDAQLKFQAENVASSITNNASFNCVATKVIITHEAWPQRQAFLDHLEKVLSQVAPRKAYYPGAADRYRKFTGKEPAASLAGTLPWTLVRGAKLDEKPVLFCEESFVCVCAETTLAARDEHDFLAKAVDFANNKLWGTLSAALTVHPTFRKSPAGAAAFERALAELRYGAIGVNHWPGLVYAMMSPPWGGYPSGTLADAQSGIGSVHNTFMLRGVQKTVLEGPLTIVPKPFWFPTHRKPETLAWKVLDLNVKPSVWKLPGLMLAALGG